MSRVVSEPEFQARLADKLAGLRVCAATGPGRSGAVASVYASHYLGCPFVPFGRPGPEGLLLIVDTARESGQTLRKAAKKYAGRDIVVIAIYEEPPRVKFWYENLRGRNEYTK